MSEPPKYGLLQSGGEAGPAPGPGHACPVTARGAGFDPFGLDYLRNPFPFLREARRDEPVFYAPDIDSWVVTAYGDILSIFRDAETFSCEITRHPVTPLCGEAAALREKYGITIEPNFVDEPAGQHRPHRRIFGEAFTPKRVNELEPRFRSIVTRYIDRFIGKGKADLVAEFLHEVPALAIFMFLGAKDDAAGMVKQSALSRSHLNFGRPTPEEQVELMHDLGELWRFTTGLVDDALASPGDNYLGDIARLYHEDSSRFTVNYLYNAAFQFQFAGHETTTQATANGITRLLENPGQWSAICTDPGLIPNAVEECLRFDPSIFHWRRLATRDATVGGQRIPAGAKILMVLGSSNHDDGQFPDGETFDITRANAKRHLTFGNGEHFCLGAPLARMEFRVILEELSRRIPGLRLAGEPDWDRTPTLLFRGVSRLPVEWDR